MSNNDHRDTIDEPPLGSTFLVTSIGLALLFTYIDEVVLATRVGVWPVLIGTGGISIASALLSRNMVLSPLCCFGATIATALLAAAIRGVNYAQFHLVIPAAIAFSLPSLTIVCLRLRLSKERNPARQFSIQSLFLLTVVAAILFALARAGVPSDGVRTALIFPTSALLVLATYIVLKRTSAKA